MPNGSTPILLYRRLAYLQANPDLSAVRRDSTVARARQHGGHAPKERGGVRPWPQSGRLPHSDPHPGGSNGPSPAPARDGGLRHDRTKPGLGGILDGRAAALPDRGPGL